MGTADATTGVLAGGTTSRVSVSSTGRQANDWSDSAALSANGRYVAFVSRASNLVPRDTNGTDDVFERDRLTGTTRRVSVGRASQGIFGSIAISANGRYVAFDSVATTLLRIFVRDMRAGVTRLVSVSTSDQQANDHSYFPSISADGRFVAFASSASNLVPGDTNETLDVFVRDMVAGVTRRVSVGPGGRQANYGTTFYSPAISADGRFVAFASDSSNLLPVATNGHAHIFVRDMRAGGTRLVSVSTSGRQGNDDSYLPSISADGRFVGFSSYASNLTAQGGTNQYTETFVRDQVARTTRLVSKTTNGQPANDSSYGTSISRSGRFIAFDSNATDLVSGDTNNTADVFIRDLALGRTQRVSVGVGGREGSDASDGPSISYDGQDVSYFSDASNLVAGDTNSTTDVFVWDVGRASSSGRS